MNDQLKHDLTWGAVSAVAVTVLTVLVDFDPDAITDYRTWAIGIGAAAIRSGAQALLQALLSARNSDA